MGNLNNFSTDAISSITKESVHNINSTRKIIDFESDWLKNFFNNIDQENAVTMKNVVIPKGGTVTCMAEPKEFMEIFKRCKDADEADKVFREFMENDLAKPKEERKYFQQFEFEYSKKDKWFNSTLKGINLRPGYKRTGDTHDTEKAPPCCLGDESVHGKVAGRTGGGKSVLLNDMICTMMYEYAPWWLDIWLADFKIVEMSRYGNKIPAPHVSVIAATEMMEYVVSVMYEMNERMSVRQNFFATLGLQKLADFYKKYKVILPQTILVVDEFQQMFELATSKQETTIEKLIKMITKLGRATGYHLLFASQSMSGTVSGDILGNFKLGIALPCDDTVSSTILGNGNAKYLKGKGKCIINEGSGSVDENREYAVPFLNADEDANGDSALLRILREMTAKVNSVGFKRELKFYRDDYIRPLTALENILPQLESRVEHMRKSDIELVDYLYLGDTALYKKGKDLEYAPIKNSDKQNIIVCGDGLDQKAYMLKLLATQYKHKKGHVHMLISGDVGLKNMYDITEDIEMAKTFRKFLPLGVIQQEMENRKLYYDFNETTDKSPESLFTYLLTGGYFELEYLFDDGIDESTLEEYEGLFEFIINKGFEALEEGQEYVEEKLKQLECLAECMDNSRNAEKALADVLGMIDVFCFHAGKYGSYSDSEYKLDTEKMPEIDIWVLGADKCADFMEEGNRNSDKFADLMKVCTNYKMRFILCCNVVKDILTVSKMCSHVLIKTENEDNYMKFNMDKKSYSPQYYRYCNRFQNVNNFKAGLEVIPNNEKLFKAYDVMFEEKEEIDLLEGVVY